MKFDFTWDSEPDLVWENYGVLLNPTAGKQQGKIKRFEKREINKRKKGKHKKQEGLGADSIKVATFNHKWILQCYFHHNETQFFIQ